MKVYGISFGFNYLFSVKSIKDKTIFTLHDNLKKQEILLPFSCLFFI